MKRYIIEYTEDDLGSLKHYLEYLKKHYRSAGKHEDAKKLVFITLPIDKLLRQVNKKGDL